MLASYTFNSTYKPSSQDWNHFPSLRLLEGGQFAPDQYSPVLVWEYQQIRLKYFQWGMLSPWTKKGQEAKGLKFAPVEQLFRHPQYHLPLRRSRCLIPADGYYVEVDKKSGQEKYKLSMPDGEGFCFAGIFDTWKRSDGTNLYSFAVITQPNSKEMYKNLRKPLILPKNVESAWLNPYTDMNKIQKILHLPTGKKMNVQRVHELKLPNSSSLDHVAA
ncbi:MAG: SOS response-associated peptidase [Bacteroidia bacterium]|nr:SOS response-associated peptidase [Bacteroidia bacterium]